jgi:RNA polymerase sigma-B factor
MTTTTPRIRSRRSTAPARHARGLPNPSEDLDLFRAYAESHDRELRNLIVERHTGFAMALARRFRNRGEPMDDLGQVALLGLLKAVERFDVAREIPFHAFAKPTILGELRRHFRDTGWSVRVPRSVQELRLAIAELVPDLGQQLGRSPTVAEIAGAAGVTEEEVLMAMEAGNLYNPDSLDREVRGESDDSSVTTRAELVGAEDDGFEAVEERHRIARLLTRLPERDRSVVYLRFYEDLTQSEIAQELGISQMHVSRLLARSLERLGTAAPAQARKR